MRLAQIMSDNLRRINSSDKKRGRNSDQGQGDSSTASTAEVLSGKTVLTRRRTAGNVMESVNMRDDSVAYVSLEGQHGDSPIFNNDDDDDSPSKTPRKIYEMRVINGEKSHLLVDETQPLDDSSASSGDDKPNVEEDESFWTITLQVFIPFLIAGMGMVGAGLVLDVVQVSN